MDIDEDQFKAIVNMVYGKPETGYRDTPPALTNDEAQALVTIARLAVDADDREDADEVAVLDRLVGWICALAQITPPAEDALPRDAIERTERLRAVLAPLAGQPSAGLGYALAYLMTISDMDIAPVEQGFVDEVGTILGIDEEKGSDLCDSIAGILTPADEDTVEA